MLGHHVQSSSGFLSGVQAAMACLRLLRTGRVSCSVLLRASVKIDSRRSGHSWQEAAMIFPVPQSVLVMT